MKRRRSTRAWLVPLLVGLATMTTTVLLAPHLIDTRPAPPPATQAESERGYSWPFPSAAGDNATFLLVAPRGSTVAAMALPGANRTLQWLTPNLATFTTANGTPPDAPAQGPIAGTDAGMFSAYPRLWPAGCCARLQSNSTVRATAYIFRAGGTLLASNDAPERADRYVRDDFYTELPNATWHLGPGPAPPGTRALPPEWRPILAPLLARLQGLGIGGVATATVSEHPHLGALGPLYVTVRIDWLDGAAPATPV